MAAINDVIDLAHDGAVGVITLDAPPVNALSARVRQGLVDAVRAANADPRIKAIVLMCAGRTFIAGADITEFGKPPLPPSLPEVLAAIESSPKPVIAAIHGAALGGGLETALAAHYRIMAQGARCGLPEVNIGLIPGAGGTQRLPRLIGVAPALEMITSGAHAPAARCLEMGLADALAPDAGLRAAAIAFAQRIADEGAPLRRVRDIEDKIDESRGRPELFADFRKANARKFRGYLAPECAIRAIEAAVERPFEDGLREERRLFTELQNGPQAPALRHVFFAERACWKIDDIPADAPARTIETVGVVGAGTMGAGIAMCFANAGIPVRLTDASAQALDRGLGVIASTYESAAQRGRMSASEAQRRQALVTRADRIEDLVRCDLAVEAAFERMDVKQDIFRRLDASMKPGAILATNTSYLDLNEIAAATQRPQDVIGLHFFSPANVMRLIEVVRGAQTAKDAVASAMQLARRIGKIAVPVGVCYGFVGNRMLAARRREADALLLEGATPWAIDRALYAFGFAMGPFQTSDLAGLDLTWNKETSRSATIREILCEQGRFGQKSGAGFYDYDEKRAPAPSPVTEGIIRDFMARHGRTPRAIDVEEILDRCLLPLINEGARILEEGIAARASDVDVIWLNGYGWPPYRGGPLYYADQISLPAVLEKLRRYESRVGEGFTPAPLIARLAAEGRSFADYTRGG
ncbi:MAG: 3-hydroxyacyl-CoA dehydrogenase NAD-binding domain-containing protein [Hyphomonadaceae bacterium]